MLIPVVMFNVDYFHGPPIAHDSAFGIACLLSGWLLSV